MTPTLATPDLMLRSYVPGQVKQHHADWINDPEVVRYSEQRHRTHSLNSCRKYVAHYNADGRHIWAIYEAASVRHIGNVTADIDFHNNVADLGILIGRTAAWGKGYGTQAWRAACDWLLEPAGGNVRKVEAGCAAINAPMRRIFDRTGMKFEGERLGHFLFGPQLVGMIYVGRFR